MKDKLEPNMYVRTKRGTFDRFMTSKKIESLTWYIFEDRGSITNPENYIINASHNIIDLIEEKDLLEIEYFSLRYEKRVTRLFEVTYKEERFINLGNAKCQFMLIDNDWTDYGKELEPIIKSIVTKEQFSSMEYRLGDNK